MERLELHLWFDRHTGALIAALEVGWFTMSIPLNLAKHVICPIVVLHFVLRV